MPNSKDQRPDPNIDPDDLDTPEIRAWAKRERRNAEGMANGADEEDEADQTDAEGTAQPDEEPPQAGPAAPGKRQRRSAADQLLDMTRNATLFQDLEGNPYIDLERRAHRETWPVRSTGVRRWLTTTFHAQTGKSPNAETLQTVINTLEARAADSDISMRVFLRAGECQGNLYLDLCDPAWRAVEITPIGWRIIDRPPLRFRRSRGMLPLLEPTHGGDMTLLRDFLRIPDNKEGDAEFALVMGWLVMTLQPDGPHPILAQIGEHGATKTSRMRMLRLTDSHVQECRAPPKEERDLMVSARCTWIPAYDNISTIQPWLSDGLCRLSTGGSFGTRALYSDEEEHTIKAQRPILINSVAEVIRAPDLVDRCVFVEPIPIADSERKEERELWQSFREATPAMLGVLLSAAATGLQRRPDLKLGKLPRMADFAKWAAACEPGFGIERDDVFLAAYESNRREAVDSIIDASPLAQAIKKIFANRPPRHGAERRSSCSRSSTTTRMNRSKGTACCGRNRQRSSAAVSVNSQERSGPKATSSISAEATSARSSSRPQPHEPITPGAQPSRAAPSVGSVGSAAAFSAFCRAIGYVGSVSSLPHVSSSLPPIPSPSSFLQGRERGVLPTVPT
jgi:hypothetical protein